MKSARLLLASFVVFGLWAAAGAAAEVRPLEFVHALQERGYHDLAVEYLDMLQQAGDLPGEVADVFDLEMSKCLRGAANRAYDAKQAAEWMDRAQAHLDKFLKEKPNHPDAVAAMVSGGSFAVDNALRLIRDAKAAAEKDKNQAAKLMADGRARLAQARKRFDDARQTLERRRAEIPAAKPATAKSRVAPKESRQVLLRRAQLDANIVEAQFQIGLVDYYVAQTYLDPKDPARIAALKSAGKVFNDIWQVRRLTATGQVDIVGVQAHMWEGKVMDDLGDWQTAVDIYDEALANDPGPGQTDKLLDPLFAQVYYYRFMILKTRRPDDFLDEASEYLSQYAKKSRHDGYQGIALEYAKALVDMAQRAEGQEKSKLTQQATSLLIAIARVPSSHQAEAVELRNKLGGGAGTAFGDPKNAKTFVEAVGIGDAAMQAAKWKEAAAAYRRALEIGDAGKDAPARTAKVKDAVARAEYLAAVDLYKANKFAEFRDAAGKIVQEFPDAPVTPDAAAMAVEAQLRLYSSISANEAEKRTAALDLLTKMAKDVENRWPGKPHADDARMAIAQASLVRGEVDEALKAFEAVSDRSERYPVAQSLAAQSYWRRYLAERQKGAQGDKDRMAADRKNALDRVAASVDRFKRAAEPGKPFAKQHVEAQLLLGEIRFDLGDAKQAAALLQPLVDQVKAEVKAERSGALDFVMLRILFGAAQAYLAIGDVARATDVGLILAELGADAPPINALLVKFVRVLDGECRKAKAAVTEAESKNEEKAHQAALARLKSAQETVGVLLKKLAQRKQLTVPEVLYIAEQCADVGLTDESAGLYQAVIDLAQKGDATAQKGLPRARARMVAQLRREGKYEEALGQVEQLIKENPRALDPQMERARILQAWAEQDPAQFDKAVAQWHFIRNLLEPNRKKFLREYYEAIYHAADCLRIQAEKAADRKAAVAKATDGAKVLTSAMVMSDKLDGDPNTLARYKALLEKLKAIISAGGK